MSRTFALLLAVSMLTTGLAGCVDGDDGGSVADVPFNDCSDDPLGLSNDGDGASSTDWDPGAVGYASAENRVLLRWTLDRSLTDGTTITVYRTGEDGESQQLAEIEPGIDADEAAAVLDDTDPRWDDLSERLVSMFSGEPWNTSDLGDVLDILDREPALASMMSDRFYPVALLTGQGHLDPLDPDDVGEEFTYRVEIDQAGDGTETLGEVTLTAGETTSFPAPTDLECISLKPNATLRAGEGAGWAEQQRDRVFDQRVLLRWNPGPTTPADGVWQNGYDVYRAPLPEDPETASSLDFEQVNNETPVFRSTDASSGEASSLTAAIDVDFVDETPQPGTWIYTVAPRDMLGNSPDPTDTEAVASHVRAPSFDTQPPGAPTNLSVEPDPVNETVDLAWNHSAPEDDPVTFRIQRTLNHSAAPTGYVDAENGTDCQQTPDETECWVEVEGGLEDPSWLDTNVSEGETYWYRVQAVDEHGNPSAPTQPMHAMLKDVTPPEPPSLSGPTIGQRQPGFPGADEIELAAADAEDTTRYLVECKFSEDGDWIQMAEAERLEDPTTVSLKQTYLPPSAPEDAVCSARAVDESGDVSERSDPIEFPSYQLRQPLAQPIITHVDTDPAPGQDEVPLETPESVGQQVGSPGDLSDPDGQIGNRIDGDSSGTEDGSEGDGSGDTGSPEDVGSTEDPSTNPPGDLSVDVPQPPPGGLVVEEEPNATVHLAWTLPPLSNVDHQVLHREDVLDGTRTSFELDAETRGFVDDTVAPGHAYRYNVTVVGPEDGKAPSEPRQIDLAHTRDDEALSRGERSLGTLQWAAVTKDRLDWTCDPCQEEALGVSLEAGGDQKLERYEAGPFAVYRSANQTEGYVQVTPVQTLVRPEGGSYHHRVVDAPADAWYVVVLFDERTGEPIASTPPEQATEAPEPSIDWDASPLVQGISIAQSPCDGDPVDPSQPLRLSQGHRITDLSLVSGSSEGEPVTGTGQLAVPIGDGETATVDVTFEDLQVVEGREPNAVCQGFVHVEPSDPIAMGEGLELHHLNLGPAGTPAVANATLELEDARLDPAPNGSADTFDKLPLRNAVLASDGSLSWSSDLSAGGHSCSSPALAFTPETAPLQIVPLGEATLANGALTVEDACTHYEDPYDVDDTLEGRPRPVADLDRGDANDGYLRTTFHAEGPLRLDPDGVSVDLSSDLPEGPLDYMASAPFAYRVQIDEGVDVTMEDSRIQDGQVRGVDVTFWHYTTASPSLPTRSATLELSPDTLDVLPGGALHGETGLSGPITWSEAYELDPAEWEILLGPVTTAGLPGQTITEPHPGPSQAIDGFGETRPEPGLNLRASSTTLTWDCSGETELDVASDVYVRHGGVSDLLRAHIADEGLGIDLHGYDVTLLSWGRAFLDNRGTGSDIAGSLDLPHPTNIEPLLDPMMPDEDGCIAGGAAQLEAELDYWDLPVDLGGIEFRDTPAEADHEGDKMLWALGAYDVPKLAPPEGEGTDLHAEMAFLPDGSFHEAQALYDRSGYELDGYTYLLEGFRLSEVGEVPQQDPEANVLEEAGQDDPEFWTEHGFVELDGRMVTPYFGPITSPAGSAPNVTIQPSDPVLAFDQHPRAEKVWVDIADVQLTWGYDLVYAQDLDGNGTSRFAGFDTHQFPPVGLLRDVLEGPLSMMDEAVEAGMEFKLEAPREPIDEAFVAIQQARADAVETVETQTLDGLDEMQATVESNVSQVFAKAREPIEELSSDDVVSTDPLVLEADKIDTIEQVLRDRIEDLQDGVHTLEGKVQQLQSVRQGTLGPLAENLTTAQQNIQSLRSGLLDARRTLAGIEGQLARAITYVDQGEQLPIELPEELLQGELPEDLETRLQELLPDGHELLDKLEEEGGFDVSEGLESVHQIVQEIRQAIDQMLFVIETVLTHAQDALQQVQALVAKTDAALEDALTVHEIVLSGASETLDEIDSLLAKVSPAATEQGVENDTLEELKDQLLAVLDEGEDKSLDGTGAFFNLLRGQAQSAIDDADAQLEELLDGVENGIDTLLTRLEGEILDPLNETRAQILLYVQGLRDKVDELLDQIAVLYLDSAPVIEPDEVGAYLGLASAPATLMGLANSTGHTAEDDWADVHQDAAGWADTLGIPYEEGYDDVMEQVWAKAAALAEGTSIADAEGPNAPQLEDTEHPIAPANTVALMDAWDRDEPDHPAFSNREIGGGTRGLLLDFGADVHGVRGQAIVSSPSGDETWQFESLQLRAKADLATDETTIFHADLIGFDIDRHAELLLFGDDLHSDVLRNPVRADATLLIKPAEPRIESGLTVRDLDLVTVLVHEAGAAVGIGDELFYLGATFDASVKASSGIQVGGSFLAGIIDPESQVLKQHYGDVVENLNDVDADVETTGTMQGLYLRAHGPIPIDKLVQTPKCTVDIEIAAEVGVWFFQQTGSDEFSQGAMLGGWEEGELLCLVTVKGRILLVSTVTQDTFQLKGDAWVVGGFGNCDPDKWNDWDDRFWGEGRTCGVGGGEIHLEYSASDGWAWDYDLDAKPPGKEDPYEE